jgi:hypothetical protein
MKTFTCFIHKPGVLTPELRVVASPSDEAVAAAIMAVSPTWPRFELIEVYDESKEPLLRIGPHATLLSN